MLQSPMTSRLIALALALVLLVTQQLGLQHLLAHGLQTARLAAAAAPAIAYVAHTADAAVAADTAHVAHVAHVADTAAGDTAAGDAASPDAAAEGLCQACLALVVLGTATLPALLRWAARLRRAVAPSAPVVRVVRRGAAAPYLARAPPTARLS